MLALYISDWSDQVTFIFPHVVPTPSCNMRSIFTQSVTVQRKKYCCLSSVLELGR